MELGKYYIRLKVSKETIVRLQELIGTNHFKAEMHKGMPYWRCQEIDNLPDSSTRYRVANEEVKYMNEILKFHSVNPKKVEKIEVLTIDSFEKHKDELIMKIEPISVSIISDLVEIETVASGSVGSGIEIPGAEADYRSIRRDKEIYEVFKRLNATENLQFEYWKAKELMVGKKSNLCKYLIKSENDEFYKWANNPLASGENSRHRLPEPNQEHIRNISDIEARRLLQKAFKKWASLKLGNGTIVQ